MENKEAWFFEYGSLIFDLLYRGEILACWCEPPLDGEIDQGVEFLHSSITSGNALFDGLRYQS